MHRNPANVITQALSGGALETKQDLERGASMIHSQNDLNEIWLKQNGQPRSDYSAVRVNKNLVLVQEFEIDVTDPRDGISRTIAYTRRRESADAEWSLWEQGISASV